MQSNKLKMIYLLPMILLFLTCFALIAESAPVPDVDANNIILKNIRLIDDKGHSPKFSRDGKSIYFDKSIVKKQGKNQYNISALFVVDKDGKNKRVFIEDACNHTWSPDRKKIAFFSQENKYENHLTVYDFENKKRYVLASFKTDFGGSVDCGTSDIEWTKDGNYIYLKKRGWGGQYLINLDSLKSENAENHWCRYNGDKKICKENEWLEANLLRVTHPKIQFYTYDKFLMNADMFAGRLWVGHRDGSFWRLLLDERINHGKIDISPDLSMIIFETEKKGIFIAEIDMMISIPVRTFRIDIGKKELLRQCTTEADYNEYLKGNMTATIYNPQINPLNNKILGAGDKEKGMVKFINILEDYSVVEVINERMLMKYGDVVKEIKAEGTNFGGQYYEGGWVKRWEGWTVLQAVDLNTKEYKEKKEKQKAVEGLGKAFVFMAAMDKGIDFFKKGQFSEALKVFENVTKNYPGAYDAWYMKGITLIKLGSNDEALESFEKAIEIKPDYDGAWYNIACIYALAGDKESALKNLSKATELNARWKEKASKDEDFKNLWDDGDFRRLVE